VLERRRPGGSDLAIIGQGSQADLSLPPRCKGVSYLKQSDKAHIRARDSVRTNGMVWESVKAEEMTTPP